MTYIAGVLTPIPLEARTRFAQFADETSGLFREFGATRVVDAVGDDVPTGEINDFNTAVQATEQETVGFGWMEYPDKAAYLAAGERMRTDPRMQHVGQIPFDGKRMIFGGFEMIVDEGEASAAGSTETRRNENASRPKTSTSTTTTGPVAPVPKSRTAP